MERRFRYEQGKRGTVVALDGKRVGTIKQVPGGYQYVTGKWKGEVCPTLLHCKRSLEGE